MRNVTARELHRLSFDELMRLADDDHLIEEWPPVMMVAQLALP